MLGQQPHGDTMFLKHSILACSVRRRARTSTDGAPGPQLVVLDGPNRRLDSLVVDYDHANKHERSHRDDNDRPPVEQPHQPETSHLHSAALLQLGRHEAETTGACKTQCQDCKQDDCNEQKGDGYS